MVMPRSRSSGALSIWSYARKDAPPDFASTLVMAAVRVVLPWSTWPIVPTFTWGFDLSNFALAIKMLLLRRRLAATRSPGLVWLVGGEDRAPGARRAAQRPRVVNRAPEKPKQDTKPVPA